MGNGACFFSKQMVNCRLSCQCVILEFSQRPFSYTVHLVSLDGLVFKTLNFFQTEDTAALTFMFGYVCSYVNALWSCGYQPKQSYKLKLITG